MSLSDRVVVMREGHIEQIGAPFEIYNFPKTQFVASFVGTLNMISASVVDAAAGKLEVDRQVFQTAGPVTQAKTGNRVLVGLRPEIISLEPGDAEKNHFRATVVLIAFLGSVVRIQVRVGENLIFFDTLNDPHLALPKVGDEIMIYFNPESILVLGTK
jgi:putative spermidine/putrescine transport system ATP-binding protein